MHPRTIRTAVRHVHECHGNRLPWKGRTIEMEIPRDLLKDEKGTYIWRYRVPEAAPVICKMYRFRGPWTTLREGMSRFRVQREFDTLSLLHAKGVSCSIPIFWSVGRDHNHGYFEIIGTREIPDVQPIKRVLQQHADKVDFSRVASMIHRMHMAGVYHGALNTRNILCGVDDNESAVYYLIDVPAAIVFPCALCHSKAAWYDLLHFAKCIARYAGAPAVHDLMDHYGFSDALKACFLRDMEAYRSSKHTRNRLRAEFKCRAFLMRAFRRRGPGGYPASVSPGK